MQHKQPQGTPLRSLFLSEFTEKYLMSQGIYTVENLINSIALLPASWESLWGKDLMEKIKTEAYLCTGKTVSDFSPLYPKAYKHLELFSGKMCLKGTKIPATTVWIEVRRKTKAFPVSRTILDWAHNNWEHSAFPLNIAGAPCIPLEAVLECVEYGDKNQALLEKQAQEEAQKIDQLTGKPKGSRFLPPPSGG